MGSGRRPAAHDRMPGGGWSGGRSGEHRDVVGDGRPRAGPPHDPAAADLVGSQADRGADTQPTAATAVKAVDPIATPREPAAPQVNDEPAPTAPQVNDEPAPTTPPASPPPMPNAPQANAPPRASEPPSRADDRPFVPEAPRASAA